MRRRVCLLLCMGMLFAFSACGGSVPPPPMNFSAEVSIVSRGSKQSAVLEAERPGVLRLVYTSPKALAGMEISIESENARIEYMGMRAQAAAASLEGAAPLLDQVLLQLAQPAEKKALRRLRGGGWERKGAANGLDYIARLNEEGALQSVKAADLEILVG